MRKFKLNKEWKIEVLPDLNSIEVIYESERNVFCHRCNHFIRNREYGSIYITKEQLKLILEELEKKKYVERQYDKKLFLEDGLLNSESVELIRRYHGGEVEIVKRHVRVVGKEVDAEIILKMKTVRRRVGIELKEYSLNQAIPQAIERRKFFHYFYIITRINKAFFGDFLYEASYKRGYFPEMFEHKIGWIGFIERVGFIMLYPSKFMKTQNVFEKWLNEKRK